MFLQKAQKTFWIPAYMESRHPRPNPGSASTVWYGCPVNIVEFWAPYSCAIICMFFFSSKKMFIDQASVRQPVATFFAGWGVGRILFQNLDCLKDFTKPGSNASPNQCGFFPSSSPGDSHLCFRSAYPLYFFQKKSRHWGILFFVKHPASRKSNTEFKYTRLEPTNNAQEIQTPLKTKPSYFEPAKFKPNVRTGHTKINKHRIWFETPQFEQNVFKPFQKNC